MDGVERRRNGRQANAVAIERFSHGPAQVLVQLVRQTANPQRRKAQMGARQPVTDDGGERFVERAGERSRENA